MTQESGATMSAGVVTDRTHVDLLLRLHVRAQIEDLSGPLPGASVEFWDVDLDMDRSRNPAAHAQHIATSDASGSVDVTFRYRWGTLVDDPNNVPGGLFELRVAHPRCRSVHVPLEVDDLPADGHTLVADLGRLVLPSRPAFRVHEAKVAVTG